MWLSAFFRSTYVFYFMPVKLFQPDSNTLGAEKATLMFLVPNGSKMRTGMCSVSKFVTQKDSVILAW